MIGMDHYIGIDGGGTQWEAALLNRANTVLARHGFGGVNVRGVNPNVVAFKLKDILEYMSDQGGMMPYHITLIVLAAAGAGDAKIKKSVEEACHSVFPNNPMKVVSDAEAALHGAFGGGPGVVLIAGTGSIAWGRDRSGTLARAGGYGHLLGDEGSGFWIGRECLKAALNEHFRGVETDLGKRICEAWNLKDITDGITLVYKSESAAKKLAELTPMAFELAKSGEVLAGEVVASAGRELGKLAKSVIRTLDLEGSVEVCFMGGLSNQVKALKPGIMQVIDNVNVELVEPAFEPTVGAVLLGRELTEQ